MKRTFILSEADIKAVMAEKFKVDPNNVAIRSDKPGQVVIIIESEVQNYDI